MQKEQLTLVAPFMGLLQLEAIRLMKEGWGIKIPIKSVWSWSRCRYVFKIVLEKNGNHQQLNGMYADLKRHLDDLADYNKLHLPPLS